MVELPTPPTTAEPPTPSLIPGKQWDPNICWIYGTWGWKKWGSAEIFLYSQVILLPYHFQLDVYFL